MAELRTHRCIALMAYSNGFGLCEQMPDPRCSECKRDDMMVELSRPVLVDSRGKRIRQLNDGEAAPQVASKVSPKPEVRPPASSHSTPTEPTNTETPSAPGLFCTNPKHYGAAVDTNGECRFCRRNRKQLDKRNELSRIARQSSATGKAKVAARTARRKERELEREAERGLANAPRFEVDDTAVVIPSGALHTIRERLRDFDGVVRVASIHKHAIGETSLQQIRNALALDIGLALIEARAGLIAAHTETSE